MERPREIVRQEEGGELEEAIGEQLIALDRPGREGRRTVEGEQSTAQPLEAGTLVAHHHRGREGLLGAVEVESRIAQGEGGARQEVLQILGLAQPLTLQPSLASR